MNKKEQLRLYKLYFSPFKAHLKTDEIDNTFNMERYYKNPSLALRDILRENDIKGTFKYFPQGDFEKPSSNFLFLYRNDVLEQAIDLSGSYKNIPYIGVSTADFVDSGRSTEADYDNCPLSFIVSKNDAIKLIENFEDFVLKYKSTSKEEEPDREFYIEWGEENLQLLRQAIQYELCAFRPNKDYERGFIDFFYGANLVECLVVQ